MTPSGIPKRIIQIWGGGSALPPLTKASMANARLLHPDFEYCFYDDARIAAFIGENFPQYAQVLDSFAQPIQKYDLLRYLIIYRFGGFYFDLDVLLSEPLTDLVGSGCVFPFERLTWARFFRTSLRIEWEIGNYAFGASPGHPFLAAVIANCLRAQTDRRWLDESLGSVPWLLRDDLHPIYATGPGLVTRTLAEYREVEHPVRILCTGDPGDRRHWNLFGSHGVHLRQSSWRKSRGYLVSRLQNLRARALEDRAIEQARRGGQRVPLELPCADLGAAPLRQMP